jgi:hypothetical protein
MVSASTFRTLNRTVFIERVRSSTVFGNQETAAESQLVGLEKTADG